MSLIMTGLCKRYGTQAALDKVDLTVPAGEFFVLLGASGSGKTTLLRCLGGFVAQDAGAVTLGGQDIGALPPHRRPVNTMFQSYALFPHMSVAANIAFGLRMQGLGRAASAARVEELLDLVRLSGFGDRRPGQLSGGQQQRVALARALAPRPLLLLLDEPFSALDEGLREETRQELAALQRRLGQTTIMVTHDQQEALSLADRIGVLQDGRLVQVGTPAALYEQPANRFIAGFLGAANILPVVRVLEDGVEVAAGQVRTSARPSAAHRFLAVRPERLGLAAGPGPGTLPGRLVRKTYHGGSLELRIALEGDLTVRLVQPLQGGLAAQDLALGQAVLVRFPPDACLLLSE